MQVARKLLGPIWNSDWSDEAKFTTTVALGQQLIFPVLVVGVVALILSVIGHGYLVGFFRFLLWLWLCAMLAVLVGMTWGAYRRLQRGDLVRYLVDGGERAGADRLSRGRQRRRHRRRGLRPQDRVQPHAQDGHLIGRWPCSPTWPCCSPRSSRSAACCSPPSSAACSTWSCCITA